jgi:hypothetical protein
MKKVSGIAECLPAFFRFLNQSFEKALSGHPGEAGGDGSARTQLAKMPPLRLQLLPANS